MADSEPEAADDGLLNSSGATGLGARRTRSEPEDPIPEPTPWRAPGRPLVLPPVSARGDRPGPSRRARGTMAGSTRHTGYGRRLRDQTAPHGRTRGSGGPDGRARRKRDSRWHQATGDHSGRRRITDAWWRP